MKNLIILGLFVFGICFVNNVYAEEGEEAAPKKEKKAKKPKAPLEDITISGTVSKVEKENKKGKVNVSYFLTDGEGNKIKLPAPKVRKKPKKSKPGEAPPPQINLEDYVDSQVTIEAKGFTKEKKGKVRTFVKKIVSIEKSAE